ncbi:MAG: hypothetical protein R3D98_17165 [Candidatus Krumholzibacteriia bacterium]
MPDLEIRLLEDGLPASGDDQVSGRGCDDQTRALPSGPEVLPLQTAQGMATHRAGWVW